MKISKNEGNSFIDISFVCRSEVQSVLQFFTVTTGGQWTVMISNTQVDS